MHHMLIPGASILEKVLRPIIVYVVLVLLLRVFGKRELAQLNPFDLVVLLSLSNTVQNAIIGEDNSVLGGLIGAGTLLLINYIVVRFVFRHRRLDEILEGAPSTLIEGGVINETALARELMTRAELETVAHRQGVHRIGEIDKMVLEPGGAFSVELKKDSAHGDLDGVLRAIAELREEVRRIGERLGA